MIRFPMVKVVFDDIDNRKARVDVTDTTFKEGMTASEKLHALYKAIGCSIITCQSTPASIGGGVNGTPS